MLSPAGIGTKVSGHSAWLDAPAAASYHRMLAAGCPGGGITDAGRTNAEQVAIFLQRYTTSWLHSSHRDRRTWLGHTYWRRVGVASAATPGESNHETGRALDLAGSALAWVRAHGAAYGWQRDRVTGEAWHIEYIESTDQHRAVAVAQTKTPPRTKTAPVEDIMRFVVTAQLNANGSRDYYVVGPDGVRYIGNPAALAPLTTLYGQPVVMNKGDITNLISALGRA